MSKDTKNGSDYASRGRRYSPSEKAQILADARSRGVASAAAKHGCSKWTLYDWLKKQDAAQTSPADADRGGESEAATTPLDERHRLILELWHEQPGLGPSQIRSLLKRRGFKASVNTVRAVMVEHGYVQPKVRRKEHPGSYEAVRPLQLCHLDFYHFHVHRQKQCLLFILDDFSRFITGWTLLRSEHADGVIETFESSVLRYGKPEGVMSDRGAAFHSWNGLSRFQALLEEYGIDFYLAREAEVNGKAEALNASVQKELVREVEFADLADARSQVARWVAFYNYRRTHHALGGLLVPADRFHGWQDETLRRIEQGNGADMQELLNPEGRGLELFRVVSLGGQPAVYLMGKKILG